jgi:hypothetical protein
MSSCIVTTGGLSTTGTISASGLVTASGFRTVNGTAQQFLKADGSVNIVTTNGLPYNPVSNATTTITAGNKSYWYTVKINQATTINGFSTYVREGSDIMRVGIYKGYLRASTSSDEIILVGESAAGPPENSGLPYIRRAIAVVDDQSLTFNPEDYMTIAFHSLGESSVFVASPNIVDTNISYSTNVNYATAGFPDTLSSTSVTSGNTPKVCFELY